MKNTSVPDYTYLYRLPASEAESIVMSMNRQEFAKFSAWASARTDRLIAKFRGRMFPGPRARFDVRNAAYQPGRHTGHLISPNLRDVFDYLAGMHPLLCRTPRDRAELAATRAAADILLEVLAEQGVHDRHEAAQIIETILARGGKQR